jgi:hypothetical protein
MSLYSINIRLESIEKVEQNIDALKRAIAVANEIDAALLTDAKNTLEILLSEVKGEVAIAALNLVPVCINVEVFDLPVRKLLPVNFNKGDSGMPKGKIKGRIVFPPCKVCRSITVARIGSAWGSIRQVFNNEGELIDTDTSRMNFRISTVVRCTHCNTIRKDITFSETKLTQK